MTHINKNIHRPMTEASAESSTDIKDEHSDFLSKLEIPFEESADELWDRISASKSTLAVGKKEVRVIQMSFTSRWAVAASIALLVLGIPLFMIFYSTTVVAEHGKHLSHILPDGSEVELNAGTEIHYRPFWWYIQREVGLKGEAFFKVQKGKRFAVNSTEGTTEVLGTSFNILARDNKYRVYCATGKVRVRSTKTDVNFTMVPGQQVTIDNVQRKGSIKEVKGNDIVFWRENKIVFNSEPILMVFSELERQYGVNIHVNLKKTDSLKFTSFFDRSENIDHSLGLICQSFGFKFARIDEDKYVVEHR